MITRYRVSLNNAQLDELFRNIYPDAVVIHDIKHTAPTFNRTIETPGSSDGGIITRTYRQSASVTVTFELRLYNIQNRKQVLDLIQAWAMGGGTLRTNDRNGQVLENVVCESFPEIESARGWTDELSMTFTNYSFPYWQQEDQYKSTITLTGTNADGVLPVLGNATESLVFVTAKPNSGTLNEFKIKVANSIIHLKDISIPSSRSLQISYDKSRNIIIGDYSGSKLRESLLSYRTADSSDLLLGKCSHQWRLYAGSGGGDPQIQELGYNNSVNVTTNVNCTTTISTRGAWL